MKFVMIGDRYSNDIVPPLRLLPNNKLLTILLHSGKYALKEPIEREQDNYPTYVAHTLAQAKAILLSGAAWQGISCTSDPPIFNLEVDREDRNLRPENLEGADIRVRIDIVLCGIAMDPDKYPTIQRICFGILWEHVTQKGREELENILAPFLDPNEVIPYENIRRRVLVLCALARSHDAMNSDLMKEIKDRFEPRLLEDRRLLETESDELTRARFWGDERELIASIRQALLALKNLQKV